jgi:putative phosphoesterase
MKIAAISDIHGNLAALEAVLADIHERGVDLIVNLGDILSGPLQPSETADRLMPLRLPTISGNHERQLLTFDPDQMRQADRFAASCLRPDQRDWLASLPETLRFDDVLLVHGSPRSDLEGFLETVTATGIHEASLDEVEERAAGADAALMLCGHTHVPRVVRLPDGRLIANPGSVGLQAYADDHPFAYQVQAGSPHARYAIVESVHGRWSAQLLAVSYDWKSAASLAEQHGRGDWGQALRTGRV